MKLKVIIPIFSSLLLIGIIGCAGAPAPDYGQINNGTNIESPAALPANEQQPTETATPPANTDTVTPAAPSTVGIGSILESGDVYSGKDVIVEGKIVNECGAGCWFNLQDDTGVIYVDLAPNNMYIPQKVGSKATVHGVVAERNGVVYIIGNKVEF
jgi:uncharacterized protein YdeI (BOF family)